MAENNIDDNLSSILQLNISFAKIRVGRAGERNQDLLAFLYFVSALSWAFDHFAIVPPSRGHLAWSIRYNTTSCGQGGKLFRLVPR